MPDGALSSDGFYSPSISKEAEPHPLDRDDETPIIRVLRKRLGNRQLVIQTDHPDPDWLNRALDEFNRVATLPRGWDSYGALPIDQDTLERAFDVFGRIMVSRAYQPQIGGINTGGISIEWHRPDKGLEIRVESPRHVYAYYYDDSKNIEWEDEVGNDLDQLVPYLDRLEV